METRPEEPRRWQPARWTGAWSCSGARSGPGCPRHSSWPQPGPSAAGGGEFAGPS